MQVVYSGGTSTPTPSPRVQRKFGYSRPTMPGYNTHVHPQVFVHRSGEVLTEGDITLRDSIPLMSKGIAILCLILNIFIPGSGTLTAGLSVLCCSQVRPRGGTKRHCIWMNAGVALIQFLLTFLFLLGWIWSITWGVAFLSISRQHGNKQNNANRHHRNGEGEKTHAKIYDTSRPAHSDSHHYSPQTGGKHSKQQHQQQTEQQRHHQHNHSHNRGSDLEYHQNNNRSHTHKHDIRKSRTPSPRDSPQITRNENSWVTLNSCAQTPPKNNDFLSPTSTKESCAPTATHQPIIVLQQASSTFNHSEGAEDTLNSSPNDAIMQARTRHMKMLQRKMGDNELSPFVLTNKQLEAIVIHDLPLVSSNGVRNSQMSEDEPDGLPKMEMS